MAKVRKDGKGRVLRKGERYDKKRKLYIYAYTTVYGERKCFYAKDLPELREKEREYERDRLDKLDVYVMAGSEYLRMKNRLCMGLREIQEQAERI